MKVKEVEELLDIPRATIRFYEKQGLLNPKRNEDNEYREYSFEDIVILKKIMILRKLGLSVSDIRSLMAEKSDLQDLIQSQLKKLEEQRKELDGVIEICNEIKASKVSFEEFDEEYYWNEISDKERHGYTFFDHISTAVQSVIYKEMQNIEYSPSHGPRTPDFMWNPLHKTTEKIQAFWMNHKVLHVILLIAFLLAFFGLLIIANY